MKGRKRVRRGKGKGKYRVKEGKKGEWRRERGGRGDEKKVDKKKGEGGGY